MKSVIDIKEIFEACEKEKAHEMKKTLYDNRDTCEMKKWKKELRKYNEENKTDVKNVYFTTENKRYAVNRGIHTMEFQKEFWVKNKIEAQRENVLLFYGKNGMLKKAYVEKNENGKYKIKIYALKKNIFLKVEKKEFKDMPKIIRIEGGNYKKNDLEIECIKHRIKFYEILEIEEKEKKEEKRNKNMATGIVRGTGSNSKKYIEYIKKKYEGK